MFRIGSPQEPEQSGTDHHKVNKPGQFDSAAFPSPESPSKSLSEGLSTSRAIPESEVLAREIKDGHLSGYVGHGTVITGDTSFKGMMRIDGHVGGKLSSEGGTIIVGDGGHVQADLDISIAIIRGSVTGDIIASQRIELGRTARVRGNIQTASLSIETGAFFEGSCRMSPIVEKNTDDYHAIAASLNAAVGDDMTDRERFS